MFAGMLGVTFFGLLLTPVFYVVIQGLADRRAERRVKQEIALYGAPVLAIDGEGAAHA